MCSRRNVRKWCVSRTCKYCYNKLALGRQLNESQQKLLDDDVVLHMQKVVRKFCTWRSTFQNSMILKLSIKLMWWHNEFMPPAMRENSIKFIRKLYSLYVSSPFDPSANCTVVFFQTTEPRSPSRDHRAESRVNIFESRVKSQYFWPDVRKKSIFI